jgi:PRTRC genetic system protein C
MAEIQTAPRVFKLGPTMLEDPDPNASPEDALALYRTNHPALAHCTLSEPYLEGDRLVYEVQRPTATTKGQPRAGLTADIEAEIAAWEQECAAESGALADPEVVANAHDLLVTINRRSAGGLLVESVDPLLIPMC